MNRLPTYNLPTQTFLRAGAAALLGGLAIGFAWAFFNIVTYVFWGVLAGIGIGYALGEIVSTATNRKAGPPLQAFAVGGVVIAFLIRTGMLFVIDDWMFEDLRLDLAGFVAAGIAGFVAAGRVR